MRRPRTDGEIVASRVNMCRWWAPGASLCLPALLAACSDQGPEIPPGVDPDFIVEPGGTFHGPVGGYPDTLYVHLDVADTIDVRAVWSGTPARVALLGAWTGPDRYAVGNELHYPARTTSRAAWNRLVLSDLATLEADSASGDYTLSVRPGGALLGASGAALASPDGGGTVTDTLWLRNYGAGAGTWNVVVRSSEGSRVSLADRVALPAHEGVLSAGPAVGNDPAASPGWTAVPFTFDAADLAREHYLFDSAFAVSSLGADWGEPPTVPLSVFVHDPLFEALLTVGPGIPIDLAHGEGDEVVVAAGGTVERVVLSTGSRSVLADGLPDWASSVAVAVSPDGSVHVADSRSGDVSTVAADGAVQVVWEAGAHVTDAPYWEISGLAVTPDGTLYISESHSGLWRVTSGEESVIVVPTGEGGCCRHVAYNAVDGRLYFADADSLLWYDPTDDVSGLVRAGVGLVRDLATGPDGHLYVPTCVRCALDGGRAFLRTFTVTGERLDDIAAPAELAALVGGTELLYAATEEGALFRLTPAFNPP